VYISSIMTQLYEMTFALFFSSAVFFCIKGGNSNFLYTFNNTEFQQSDNNSSNITNKLYSINDEK